MLDAGGMTGSVRERLLRAASDLFYEEGIHTVGIDRVLERAGVAKASLYATFGGKEELVCAYLRRRSEDRQADIAQRMARHASPRDRILCIFELLEERVADATFRGCAFLNASVEGPRGPTAVRQVATRHRAWLSSTFASLATEAGVSDPRRVAAELVILYDGALVGSLMEGTPETTAFARRMAALLLDAEAKPPRGARSRPERAKARRPR